MRGKKFRWGSRTYIMGVLNVTPDSFSDGGAFLDPEAAAARSEKLVSDGADILDIGGESSRPFSDPVSAEEELDRIIPVLKEIREVTDCPVSVDTVKASVAEEALKHGADMVNDISGLRFDPGLADVVVRYGVPVVLMHMKGSPRDMQVDPVYEDLPGEVRSFLEERVEWAEARGIPREKIIIDPGIGFGKTFRDNLVLLNRMDVFAGLGQPVLAGASRKAFIGALTGIEDAGMRDVPSLGAAAAAVIRGAHMVRVHNVALTRQVLQVVDAVLREDLDGGQG
ncbi:MAG TPA: dihydropteroate synthase [Thermodesulfobacteriaceae bacterium]|nr:dihydropteroate synthase [Thermodesulfobacteriaceae bacterium]